MRQNVLLVRWRDGYLEEVDLASVIADGRREGFLSLSDVGSASEARRVARATMRDTAAEQVAFEAKFEDLGGAQPYVDFVKGDTITVPDIDSTPVAVRVLAITPSTDKVGDPVYDVELGSLLEPFEHRMARVVKRMSNGTLGGRSRSAMPASFAPLLPSKDAVATTGGVRFATIVVAAADSTLSDLSGDFVCSGTDDDVTIAAAVTAAGSGKVVLLEGTFNLGSSSDITVNEIEGQGPGTILNGDGNVQIADDCKVAAVHFIGATVELHDLSEAAHCIFENTPVTMQTNSVMSECSWTGDTWSGPALNLGDSGVLVDCTFHDITFSGSYLIQNFSGQHTHFIGCRFVSVSVDQQMILGADDIMESCFFSNCSAVANIVSEVDLLGCYFYSCTVEDSSILTVSIASVQKRCLGNTFDECHARNNTTVAAIVWMGTHNFAVANDNVFSLCSGTLSGDCDDAILCVVDSCNVLANTAQSCTFSDVTFYDNGSGNNFAYNQE